MSDRAKLEEAIAWLNRRRDVAVETPYMWRAIAETIRAALVAQIDALPKIKMVEVWHVESAVKNGAWKARVRAFENETEARNFAATIALHPARKHVRVTGPHQQEVPA